MFQSARSLFSFLLMIALNLVSLFLSVRLLYFIFVNLQSLLNSFQNLFLLDPIFFPCFSPCIFYSSMFSFFYTIYCQPCFLTVNQACVFSKRTIYFSFFGLLFCFYLFHQTSRVYSFLSLFSWSKPRWRVSKRAFHCDLIVLMLLFVFIIPIVFLALNIF